MWRPAKVFWGFFPLRRVMLRLHDRDPPVLQQRLPAPSEAMSSPPPGLPNGAHQAPPRWSWQDSSLTLTNACANSVPTSHKSVGKEEQALLARLLLNTTETPEQTLKKSSNPGDVDHD